MILYPEFPPLPATLNTGIPKTRHLKQQGLLKSLGYRHEIQFQPHGGRHPMSIRQKDKKQYGHFQREPALMSQSLPKANRPWKEPQSDSKFFDLKYRVWHKQPSQITEK